MLASPSGFSALPIAGDRNRQNTDVLPYLCHVPARRITTLTSKQRKKVASVLLRWSRITNARSMLQARAATGSLEAAADLVALEEAVHEHVVTQNLDVLDTWLRRRHEFSDHWYVYDDVWQLLVAWARCGFDASKLEDSACWELGQVADVVGVKTTAVLAVLRVPSIITTAKRSGVKDPLVREVLANLGLPSRRHAIRKQTEWLRERNLEWLRKPNKEQKARLVAAKARLDAMIAKTFKEHPELEADYNAAMSARKPVPVTRRRR